MTKAVISKIAPFFFIVRDAAAALSFYGDRLGFEITFQEPAAAPFFGIVSRGGVMIMLSSLLKYSRMVDCEQFSTRGQERRMSIFQ